MPLNRVLFGWQLFATLEITPAMGGAKPGDLETGPIGFHVGNKLESQFASRAAIAVRDN